MHVHTQTHTHIPWGWGSDMSNEAMCASAQSLILLKCHESVRLRMIDLFITVFM